MPSYGSPLAADMANLARQPDFALAWNNRGNALSTLGHHGAAASAYRRASRVDPDFAQSHNNLGTALRAQGAHERAAAAFRHVLAAWPDFAVAHYNQGIVLQDRGRLAAAEACFRRALILRGDLAEAHGSLANVLKAQGRLADAIKSYRRALSQSPEAAETHKNLGIALLSDGQFADGWQEYAWRWRTGEALRRRRDFGVPRWQGEDLDGRIILLHADQGLGDALQFCRYAPLVAARGGRVMLEVQRPLVRLLGRLAGIESIVARGDRLPRVDLQCPLTGLPQVFETRLESIPAAIPYLRAAPDGVAAWRARLPVTGLRIGLVWQGNPTFEKDGDRSLAPALLAPLAAPHDAGGLTFVSLQKDGPPWPGAFPLIDAMAEIDDFADTAALIGALDLVISVDTAVAHLAGAMGKPVWLLNRADSCWRWLRHRHDSPWYPTLRQFRQSAPGDWAGVIAEVVLALSSADFSAPFDCAML